MQRILVPSDSPFAATVGFSRAVRVGAHVTVGGTAPLDESGATVGVGDPGAQARQCLRTIIAALEAAGATAADVVRTRTMLTRIDDWKAVANARAEFFRDIRPVDTIVEVSRFINPDWLVEFEVDAIICAR